MKSEKSLDIAETYLNIPRLSKGRLFNWLSTSITMLSIPETVGFSGLSYPYISSLPPFFFGSTATF